MKAQFIDGQGFAHEQLREVVNLTAAVRDDAGRQTGITGLYFLDR